MAKAKVKIATAKKPVALPQATATDSVSAPAIGSRAIMSNAQASVKGPANNATITANLTPNAATQLKEKMAAETAGARDNAVDVSGDDNNIYDPSIGYGKAKKTADGMWAETGTQAVARIKKARVSKK